MNHVHLQKSHFILYVPSQYTSSRGMQQQHVWQLHFLLVRCISELVLYVHDYRYLFSKFYAKSLAGDFMRSFQAFE